MLFLYEEHLKIDIWNSIQTVLWMRGSRLATHNSLFIICADQLTQGNTICWLSTFLIIILILNNSYLLHIIVIKILHSPRQECYWGLKESGHMTGEVRLDVVSFNWCWNSGDWAEKRREREETGLGGWERVCGGDCRLDYTPVTPLQHNSPPTTGPDYHYTE